MRYINKKTGFTLFLIFASLLFYNLLLKTYARLIIEPILSTVVSNCILDLICGLIVCFSILFCIKYVKDQKSIKNEYFLISIIAIILYINFRTSEDYYFIPVKVSNSIYYADVTFLLILVIIINILYWVKKNNAPSDNQMPFLMDTPLEGSETNANDLFGYSKFAKQIALKIQSKQPNPDCGSLAIGIMGEWGTGKTSFINLIKGEIDPANRVLIDFYPWRSSNKKNIIEDFFELLISELSALDSRLSANLTNYAKSLTEIDENSITKGLKTVSEYIIGTENKNINYSLVNDVLRKSNKQILIFIDDLDRLDKKEIIEVLRIIRNTANFKNTVYIVGYDRGYIEEAIKDINPHKHESYLEKIFQFELTLPYIDPEIIRFNLQKILIDKVEHQYLNELKKVIYLKFGGERYFVNEIMRNQRDVIRFANSFLFDFSFVKSEVHPKDFLLFQLLKWQFPFQYDQLRLHRFLYLTISEEFQGRPILRLRKKGEEDFPDGLITTLRGVKEMPNETTAAKSEEVTIYEEHINNDKKLNQFDKKFIISLVKRIIEQKNIIDENEAQFYNSFIFPSKFSNYFKLALTDLEIPTKDFEDARRSSFDVYSTAVDKWIDANMYPALLDRLSNISKYETKVELENHLNILWKLGRKYYLFGDSTKFHIFIAFKAFSNATKYEYLFPKQKTDNLRSFILNHLKNEIINPFFAVEIIFMLIMDEAPFPVSKAELEELNYKYLERECKNDTVDNYLTVLYQHCVLFDPKNTSNHYTMNEKATLLFREQVRKHINACQFGLFIKEISPGSNKFYIEKSELEFYFETYKEFSDYLINAKNIDKQTNCYLEMEQFLNELNYEKNNNAPISFTFKHLKPRRWQ